MKKPRTPQTPRWIVNLRELMESHKLNPRSLSLKSGLNATAVRDMLEGRTRFPRYDTVLALCAVLDVTPTQLMGGEARPADGGTAGVVKMERPMAEDVKAAPVASPKTYQARKISETDDDLELLTEIITRLQEVAEENQHQLTPRDFAAMVTTIYKRTREPAPQKSRFEGALNPKIHDLMAYEMLRRKAKG